ncbi:hypothetical protein M436DRAFT_44238 [Aureobasidium namibiae CBS 147.97]|uniref:Uncharacterized protein n=1 Tax=Aureobasidium namibiae CBS 147.97 TaxID=1043004 RepID=A0A074WXA5_9PEZI|nr:uncharacterized protein M436DRAFT_44238 [Aureobasidium namibiae CBS 147.97]KEQ74402.1 hypothetical protein M436DRAFT_44238 [Aureobasidium namibiae CBS 147.97]
MDSHPNGSRVLPQTQSPLFKLPGELRNWIYELALTPEAPIVNPTWETTIHPQHQQIPSMGMALLRACRATYLETNDSVSLKKGEFIFTRVAHIQSFFSRLSLAQASHVRHITIDLREAASEDTTLQREQSTIVANEWIHYFCCTRGAHMMGAWCADLGTLKSDVPHLRSLCLDLTNWQPNHAGSRIVPWSLGLWFSPAFDKDQTALIDLAEQTVRLAGETETRLIEWRTLEGVTRLKVHVDELHNIRPLTSCGTSLSQGGRMSWDAFVEFKDDQTELVKKRKASLSASNIIWNSALSVQA